MRWLLSGTGPVRAIDQSVAAGRPPVDRPTLHFVDGRGLLLDAAARRLYLLNNSATLILSLLDEGQSAAAICQLLTDRYAVAPEAAARLVADVLRQLEAAKSDGARGSAAAPPAPAFHRIPAHAAETRHYGLHRSVFRVDYGSLALCEAVHPLLEALAIPAAPALPVAIEAAGRAVSIVADGREIGSAPTVDAAAVAVRASLTQLAVERSGGLCGCMRAPWRQMVEHCCCPAMPAMARAPCPPASPPMASTC
jgi:Coenzyme PQQ synthesis protein D (PqqD)